MSGRIRWKAIRERRENEARVEREFRIKKAVWKLALGDWREENPDNHSELVVPLGIERVKDA